LRSTDPTPQNGLAIVVAAESGRRVKFFEIKILIFKSPVCKDLRGANRISIQQLSCNPYFAEIDPEKKRQGIFHRCSGFFGGCPFGETI
jgi:hypothetical protein